MPAEETLILELPCHPATGCGITIVGSRSSGIAIKSLLPGGVAHLDGRLKVGDKLILVDGRRTALLTCAQVAQYLRRQNRVQLEIHRPDYDLIASKSLRRFSAKKTNQSYMSYSYTFSAVSELQAGSRRESPPDFQKDMDCETQTLSTEVDSLNATPTVSCSDLMVASSKSTKNTQFTGLAGPTTPTAPKDANTKSSFSFYYSGFDRLKKLMNILPKTHKEEVNEIELTGTSRYQAFTNGSISSDSSNARDSGVDSDVFRVDSSEVLICPGGM
ncbi:uncharacterized protein [Watersipora subatra]|uniref:uncharacterized protein n=1 Tax=Watersipora subatra TaxID=2589382 RepID=UPI00355C6BE9